jgi:hypothetical protein
VQLYWDDNFGGSVLTLTADNSCLVANGWNDKASSLKISAASAVTARTATEVAANKELLIYPNPVVQELRFNTTQPLSGATIKIVDVMGREVLRTRYISNSIDVSQLTAGVYTLVVNTNDKIITKRFLKQ